MKEFRLVIYMNASASRGFCGGRGAASPLAYYCHLKKRKNCKVFLGGPIKLNGLGKYHGSVKKKLDEASMPLKLPHCIRCDGEYIRISGKAYIYQNDDPLLSNSKSGIYWTATIDEIGLPETFSDEDIAELTLNAVRVGRKEEYEGKADNRKGEPRVLVSRLYKLREPLLDSSLEKLKVYDGNHNERKFWDNGKPSILYQNAFVYKTRGSWRKFDKSAKAKEVNIKKLIDSQIKHNHINESLVHEMLKIMFASKGWWVNYELPIREGRKRGRIDILIKQDQDSDWQVIEVKLDDNPDAVKQLKDYIKDIECDVQENEEDSNFWMLWNGKGCEKIKGVIICKSPGNETVAEVGARKLPYDIWTYRYTVKGKQIGIEVSDARNEKKILYLPSK